MTGSEPQAQKRLWHFRSGYRHNRDESFFHYERFVYFLSLGPTRRQVDVAKYFKVSGPSINTAAKTFNWVKRAQAWDNSQPNADDIPDLLAAAAEHGKAFDRFSIPQEQIAAVAALPVVAQPPGRMASRAARIERLRGLSEQVGERHMTCSLEMAGSIQLLQGQLHRLLTRWSDEAQEQDLAQMLNSSDRVVETVSKLSRSIASMAAGSAQLATVGAERWGAALGIDVVMGQLQDFLKRQQQQAAAHPAPQGPGPVGQEVPP